MKSIIFTIFISILVFTGCTPKYEVIEDVSPKAKLKKVTFNDIPGFYEDDLELAFEVFKKDCKRSYKFDLFKNVCEKAKEYTNASEFFTTNFTPYELVNKDGSNLGTITGYFEPLLNGSLEKSEKYKYPIYKTPDDMIIVDLTDIYPELKKYRLRGKVEGNKLIPYDDRKKINGREDLEAICYVDDRLELFFLQIQGSGKVRLENGELLNIGYANQNGHKFTGIGKILLKEDVLEGYGATMQGIKAYLKDNPERMDEILNKNKSYIFFSQRKVGASGALGTPLTGYRNLAVDRRYIPLGMPVFINTKNSVTNEPIANLTVAADVGGAIKGQIRADFFYGFGKDAELFAGGMHEKGTLTILVPND
jgi:membrane-bound lytic murein transglycosylase A